MNTNSISIVKIGGSAIFKEEYKIPDVIKKINKKVILVYGYSRKLNELIDITQYNRKRYISASGIESYKVDNKMLEYSIMANGVQATNLIHTLQLQNLNAISLTGLNKNMIKAIRKSPRYYENGCLVKLKGDNSGKINFINFEAIMELFCFYDVICLGPILYSDDGPLVCDADNLAVKLALAMRVNNLTLFTDQHGVIVNEDIVARITSGTIDSYIDLTSEGMRKKLKIVKPLVRNHNTSVTITNLDNFLNDTNVYTLITNEVNKNDEIFTY
ncbi:hypothetical protein [Bacillus cereus]|uniref:amino acid kinase family protein n=1 Tax=Bacillus cereus TaxID=1396 RepID=UPI000BF77709|nr:hypothetical protein [Bacillus cereus]PER10583.1 hypothetical protein CN489_17605 [Bacillus cereus]PFI78834.1 hypothetical protein COI83_26830 [Bacillus cereus]PFO99853.1 hypothetical protein COJ97_15140 [Bacillus cereus]